MVIGMMYAVTQAVRRDVASVSGRVVLALLNVMPPAAKAGLKVLSSGQRHVLQRLSPAAAGHIPKANTGASC